MLRVLEMREVTPLGTNDVRPVDLRVVAAAKVDLGDHAQRKDFREDLYYRLNVVALSIPPLRERRDDVPLLFSHFCHRAGQRFGREIPDLSPSVTRHLSEHDWPGNVRELSHFAERFVLGLEGQPEPQASPRVLVSDAAGSLPDRLARLEAEIIRETLSRNGGDVRRRSRNSVFLARPSMTSFNDTASCAASLPARREATSSSSPIAGTAKCW